MIEQCVCPAAGWCERHKRQMSVKTHQLCQTSETYRKAFAKPSGEQPRRQLLTQRDLPCVHRLDVVRVDKCRLADCKGGVEVEVFSCAKHGECTVNQHAIPGVSVCKKCKDRSEATTGPVAVVITSHNYGRFLGECVESVLRQTMRPEEIIVVDDASTDDTHEVAERYPEVRYIRVEHWHCHKSRRTGFENTTAEWLCFLDADDTLPPGYLAGAMAKVGNGIGIVYSDLQQFGADTSLRVLTPLEIDRQNYIHAGSLVRRVAIETARALDIAPNIEAAEDWYTWRKVLRDGWKTAKNDTAYHYRRHDASRTADWTKWTYFERAALAFDDVTIAIPLSGRMQWWSRMADWLSNQAWPHCQSRILLVDTSGDDKFSETVRAWLAECDYPAVQYIALDVGLRGLADADRHQQDVYRSVQQAMPRIYNRIRREVSTPWTMIIEDDILPPDNAIERLLQAMDDKTVSVSGAYRSRYQDAFVAWSRSDPPTPFQQAQKGVKQVGGNGFGCVVIRSSVLRDTVLHHGGRRGDFDPNFYADNPGWTAKIDWDVRCDHAGDGFWR